MLWRMVFNMRVIEIPAWLDEKDVRIAMAAQLFKEGKVTLKQGAEIAGLSIWDFLYELGKRKISYTNITPEDLEEELKEI